VQLMHKANAAAAAVTEVAVAVTDFMSAGIVHAGTSGAAELMHATAGAAAVPAPPLPVPPAAVAPAIPSLATDLVTRADLQQAVRALSAQITVLGDDLMRRLEQMAARTATQ
jgi:hypothetical protein